MSNPARSRPPVEQPTPSRERTASIFKPFASRNPSSPFKSSVSPRKPSRDLSPSKRSQRLADAETTPVSSGSPALDFNVLQDVHNRSATSPRKAMKDDPSKSPSKLANIFGRARSKSRPAQPRDKENTTPTKTPPTSAHLHDKPPPIWAEFSSTHSAEARNSRDGSTCAADQTQTSRLSTERQQRRSQPVSSTADHGQSRVKAAVAMYNQKQPTRTAEPQSASLQGTDLENAFEAVLMSRNIPENMRQTMRGLDAHIKRDFIKNNGSFAVEPIKDAGEDTKSSSVWGRARARSSARGRDAKCNDEMKQSDADTQKRARSRSRGRVFTLSKGEKGDKSPSKRPRSNSRPRSLMSLKNLSSSSISSLGFGVDGSKDSKLQNGSTTSGSDPQEYVSYLKSEQKLEDVLVGRIANLRRLVRNESVSWTDGFITLGGMSALIELLQRIMKVEWREEHEDALLHEVLRTLKGLSTTQRALANLALMAPSLFPDLLRMLFDEERKGPSEFATREIIMWLLLQHLSTSLPAERSSRARAILQYLSNPAPPEDEQPPDFLSDMRQHRPYLIWCKEVDNVTKEVFWIFLHHMNVVPTLEQSSNVSSADEYHQKFFPRVRPPVPAAPYVGGVEWDATNYLASHLDLMNGLIASMDTARDRNRVREEMRDSGFEKIMGSYLRTVKEKFYSSIHDGLRTWVAAAYADGWDTLEVSAGPKKSSPSKSPQKSGICGKDAEAPKLQLPTFELDESEKKPQRHDDMWI